MKRLPDITMTDWMQAEQEYQKQKLVPPVQPQGSITVVQFAEMRGISLSHAGNILSGMMRTGLARKEPWHRGTCVYFLEKKK